MPVKSEQELQTLNVQNLNVKSNLYGNLSIPPLNGSKTGETLIQKARSLETGVHLAEINGNDSQYHSMQSIDSLNNNRNKGQQSRKILEKGAINRYDSGYGSYIDFHNETSFHESIESEILTEEPDHLNEIECINANNQYVISEWQSVTTSDGLSSFELQSPDITFSTPVIPLVPESHSKIATPVPESVPKPKRNEYIRLVERFGTDLKDVCLFPLALPMDGSDVYKGKSDWQTITLLADCVLTKWIEASEKSIKIVNKVLPNASKFLCPAPELQTRVLQFPNAKLPLRRSNSELDFQKLGLIERKELVFSKTIRKQVSKADGFFIGVRDDIDVNVSNEKGRYRAHTSLSVRRKSVHFQIPKQRKDKFDLRIGGNLKTDAKVLVESIRLENPISLALQITKIEKDLMIGLPSDEIMALVLKKGKHSEKTSHLNKLLQFGQELSQLVADIIVREATVEAQGKKIAAIIEVGCVLRKLRNWQSLSSLIRGLQLPQIYCLSNAWSVTRTKYPIHFNDYLRLCRVVRNDSIAILRSREPSIPSITSFISLLRVRCLATWDRLESVPRWTESPNLVQWLERQMLNSIAIEQSVAKSAERMTAAIQLKNKKQEKIVAIVDKFHEKSETHLEKCIKQLSPEKQSFLPLCDPIYFIEDDHLPITWTLRSARNIPAKYQSKIIRCFKNSYKLELTHIENYKMN